MFPSLLINQTRRKLVSVRGLWESLNCSSSSASLVSPKTQVLEGRWTIWKLSFPQCLPVILWLFFFFFKLWVYLFIYLWLCWVFVSVRGLSLVAASGGHPSSRCARLSPLRPLPLRSTGSRRAGSVMWLTSVIVAHGPSRSAACGIFPDQGSNPCPLHWQADSQPQIGRASCRERV